MLAQFFSWIRQIIYLMLFLILALQILPSGKDRKYVRFFAGLIFVVGLLNPLVQMLQGADLGSYIAEKTFSYDLEVTQAPDFDEIEEQREQFYTRNAQEITEEYEK